MKNTIIQADLNDILDFGKHLINEVLDQRTTQPDKFISVVEYDRRNGTKRQTTLKNLREGNLEGKKVGKFWMVKV